MATADCAMINPEGRARRVLNQDSSGGPPLLAYSCVLAFRAGILLPPF